MLEADFCKELEKNRNMMHTLAPQWFYGLWLKLMISPMPLFKKNKLKEPSLKKKMKPIFNIYPWAEGLLRARKSGDGQRKMRMLSVFSR